MARRCNGPDQNCDNCTYGGDCESYIECDICGGDCGEEYYEIDGEDICENCLKEHFRRIAG